MCRRGRGVLGEYVEITGSAAAMAQAFDGDRNQYARVPSWS